MGRHAGPTVDDGPPGEDALAELASIADLIGSTRVAGIPTLFAPMEGPITAGLYFRVGRADETLATAGITHLVEHLALFGLSSDDLHHNAETNDNYTHFHVTGTEVQVVAYLNGVCAALSNLPLERIQVEKEILKTEAARNPAGAASMQRNERYGAEGMGVVAHGELGLLALTPDHLIEWTRTRFTRGNCVLWITSAQAPAGLTLSLPEGRWLPVPPHSAREISKPAYFRGLQGGVLFDSVIVRTAAGAVFAQIASKALFRALRQEGGFSYVATCEYEPIDAHRARVVIYADALLEQQAAVIGATIDVLAALRAGKVDTTDLAAVQDSFAQIATVPSLGAALLPITALNLILGAPIDHPLELVEKRRNVSATELAWVADAVWRDLVAQVPEGSLEWAGFTQTPQWSLGSVTGVRYPRLDDPTQMVVIGTDRAALATPNGSSIVLFQRCAAYLMMPDGARTLIGEDGFRVPLEPTMHAGITPEVVAALDAQIPPRVHLRTPNRDPLHIPQPPVDLAAKPGRKASAGWPKRER